MIAEPEAIWHDVECGAYAADLALWEQLAAAGGRAGARARRRHWPGCPRDSPATATRSSRSTPRPSCSRRCDSARATEIEVETVVADARSFHLDRRFAAILAPMQFVHLLGGPARSRRDACRGRCHLAPGGTFVAALLDDEAVSAARRPGRRRYRTFARSTAGSTRACPSRSPTSRAGSRSGDCARPSPRRASSRSSTEAIRLDTVDAGELEAEAPLHGLVPRERIADPATADHVGSIVCVLEAAR